MTLGRCSAPERRTASALPPSAISRAAALFTAGARRDAVGSELVVAELPMSRAGGVHDQALCVATLARWGQSVMFE